MITVDPTTGKYFDQKENRFHVQYFGSDPCEGYAYTCEDNFRIYKGRANFELAPGENDKEWLIACDEADEALKLERDKRIEQLTFEYVVLQKRTATKKTVKFTEPPTNKRRRIDDNIHAIPSTMETRGRKKTAQKNPGDDDDISDDGFEFDDELDK